MGLDATIYKRPKAEKKEVMYWRKNWILQYWIETENCEVEMIDADTLERFIKYVEETVDGGEELRGGGGSWDQERIDDMIDQVRTVIEDMKRNESYEYSYEPWW
jgi:hypothetical protein